MATRLQKSLKREITVDGKPFVVTLAPKCLKLVGKGRRKGLELLWTDLVSGEAALATALNASLNPALHLEPGARSAGKARKRRKKARTRSR
jgi:hypothetical protein